MNIQEMTAEQLRSEILKVTDDMALIRSRLQEARTRVYRTGEHADPDWYHRASEALRFRGRDMRKLQDELGKRNREQKKANVVVSRSNFEKAARQLLNNETFMEIATLANSMSTQQSEV